MSCDHELANEWARCSRKNGSYITTAVIALHTIHKAIGCKVELHYLMYFLMCSCFLDRATAIGQSINSYLQGKADLEDHAIHLLFSANRWEAV